MSTWMSRLVIGLCLCVSGACSDDAEASAIGVDPGIQTDVEPPFEVAGEAEGLLLVWFDAEGVHQSSRRSDIPWAHRRRVRVDSLSLAPDERLDPAYVYVADLREPHEEDSYRVSQVPRERFEAWVAAAGQVQAEPTDPPGVGADSPPAAGPSGDQTIVIYGASWCGACRAAAAYLRQRGVAFAEKDIERDAAARAEMEQGMRAAGLRGGGIPVINFRGRWLQGFDQREFDRLLRAGAGGS